MTEENFRLDSASIRKQLAQELINEQDPDISFADFAGDWLMLVHIVDPHKAMQALKGFEYGRYFGTAGAEKFVRACGFYEDRQEPEELASRAFNMAAVQILDEALKQSDMDEDSPMTKENVEKLNKQIIG